MPSPACPACPPLHAPHIEYSLDAGSTKGSDLVGLVEPKVDPLLTDEEVPTERFVKAVLTSGEYLMCHVNGFITKYFVLDAEIARDLFCQHSAEDVLDVASVRSLRSTARPSPPRILLRTRFK